jgi:hypothetical protein
VVLLGGCSFTNISLPDRQSLRTELKGLRKQTLLQTTSLVERRTVLLKRVQCFREIQRLYMPGFDPKNCTQTERSGTVTSSTHIEDAKLYLPSELAAADRRKYCPNGLAAMEDRIRYAEAFDALEDLRHHLRTRSFTNKFKIANVTGQIKNTRAREVQHRIDDKVRASELHYRRAREGVKKLRGPGEWEQKLRVLEKSDVRALNERELTQQEKDDVEQLRSRLGTNTGDVNEERMVTQVAAVGEGARRPSWIWFSGTASEGMDDPLTRKGLSHSLSIVISADLLDSSSCGVGQSQGSC